MTKIAARVADRFVRTVPGPETRAVLIYGPDDGLVRERSTKLLETVLGGERDPFRFVELTLSDLASDPARLSDEAASLSLTGGRRLVFVRGVTDSIADSMVGLLEDGPGDALIVCAAGNLPPRSRLRAAFEKSDNAAAVPCYADGAADLASVIEATVKEAGQTIDRAATAYLTEWLGADRALTRQEIEKLILFKGKGEGPISENDARACVGDGSALELEDLTYAVADGEQALLDARLSRLFREGNEPVSILRRMGSHFQRLQMARAALDSGSAPEDAMRTLRPPVFFQRKAAFAQQLQRWSQDKVSGAMNVITEAELDCKTTGLPAEAICGRALMRVSAGARGRRSN